MAPSPLFLSLAHQTSLPPASPQVHPPSAFLFNILFIYFVYYFIILIILINNNDLYLYNNKYSISLTYELFNLILNVFNIFK